MNLVAHLALGLLIIVALWVGTRKAAQGGPDRRAAIASAGALALLLLFGVASAIVNGGDSFGAAQILAWTAFFHVPVYQLGAGFLLKGTPRVALVHWATVALLGLAALEAFVIEPHWLQVSNLILPTSKVTEPVRVVVLADIQTDVPGPYEARVLRTAMAQDPDLILFAGDYIQLGRRSRSYADEIDALRVLMVEAGLHAPLGAYAVAGNVDEPGMWTGAFAGLPVVTIEETTSYNLGPLALTGLGMGDAFGHRVEIPPQDAFHIVIGHSPNFSLGPVEADLLIAGHTHGGQVRLPLIGPLLNLSRVPRGWIAGATMLAHGGTLVVSRGIGMERANAPRVRFLCRPELVVIDLVPSP